MTAVLCPVGASARNKKNEGKARVTAKAEPKKNAARIQTADPNGHKSAGNGGGADKTAAEKESGAGEKTGVPTKEYREEDFKPPVEEESYAWSFIKMLLVLGLFAAGFYYFYRFVTRKTGVNVFGREAIKVLSVVPLGQNKYLDVIDLAGKVMVIGVSENSINLIAEITDRDQIDRIRILSAKTPPRDRGGGGFHENILRQIGKFIGRVHDYKSGDRYKSTTVEYPSDIEYLKRQKERLKNLNGIDDE
jgi:flagellar protein FliO/FliZ